MGTQYEDSAGVRDIEELLLCRAYLYQLFANFLGGEPDETACELLFGEDTTDVVQAFAGENATMDGFARLLERAKSDSALVERVRDEFARVLIGPASLPAQPVESAYVSNEAMLFQENTLEVRRLYRSRGYCLVHENRVPDDHVACMCAFLCATSLDMVEILRRGDSVALGESLRADQAFVGSHLVKWVSEYALQLRRVDNAVLYPQLVEALSGFIEQDAVFLSEAAYWVETSDGWGAVAGLADNALEQAVDLLASMDLFGLDDFRLQRLAVA